jgi:AcrR family transcriptional regulator
MRLNMKKASSAGHSHSKASARQALSPRKKPVQERSRATVDAILQGGSQVLVRVGYEQANTTLIAKAAGVSVGTLYQYFPNKEALFSALLRRELTAVMDKMSAAVAALPSAQLADQVHASVAALVEYKARNPRLQRALKTELGRLDGTRALKQLNERALALVSAVLEVHRDELPLTNIPRAAFFVVNTVEGILSAALIDDPTALNEPGFARELSAAAQAVLHSLAAW